MHTVTNLVPAPGVLFAFDERACAVVDTINDSWHYFTEGRAWAWQAVHVTGTVNSLDDEEVNYVAEFMDEGLMINDTKTLMNPIFESKEAFYGAEDVEDVEIPSGRSLRKVISRSWSEAVNMERSTLASALRTLRYAHEEGFPFAPTATAENLQGFILRKIPWWVPARYRTSRNIATATVVAAHILGARIDISFGVSHQTREPTFWCSTPGGSVGKSEDILAIGRE